MTGSTLTHAVATAASSAGTRVRAVAGELRLAAAVLTGGAVLRFAGLGQESYWTDEITMLAVAGGSFDDAAATVMKGRPPAFVFLLNWWIALVGTGEVATRALTAIIGVAALGWLYALGRRLAGPVAALAATALMALAPIQIYQSQNIRYYGLVVLLAIAATHAMVRLLGGGGRRWLAAYVAFAALLVYAHTYGVFVVAAHDLYLLLALRRHRARLGAWAAGQVAVAVLVAPFLWISTTHVGAGGQNPTTWLPPVVPGNLVRTLVEFLTFVRPGPVALALAALCLAAGALVARRLRRDVAHAGSPTEPAAAEGRVRVGLLLACWLIVPLAAPYVLSLLLVPMYHTRYTLGGSPALYLLIGLLVARAARHVAPVFGAAAVCALVVPATVAYYPQQLKEDWRGVSAYLTGAARPGDRVILAPGEHGDTERALRWYLDAPLAACSPDDAVVGDPAAVAGEVRRCAVGAKRIWLLTRGPEPLTAPFVRFVREEWAGEMRPVEVRGFAGIDLYLVERVTREEAAR